MRGGLCLEFLVQSYVWQKPDICVITAPVIRKLHSPGSVTLQLPSLPKADSWPEQGQTHSVGASGIAVWKQENFSVESIS